MRTSWASADFFSRGGQKFSKGGWGGGKNLLFAWKATKMILFFPKKSKNRLFLAGQGGGQEPPLPSPEYAHAEHFCLMSEHTFFSSRFRENSPLTLDSNTQVFPTTTTSDGSGSGESSYYESVFRLNNVHPDQSGEFECRPQGLPSAKVNLHIVKGNLS